MAPATFVLLTADDMTFPGQAAFLLPWRRVFNLSDSQLSVARRENAKALFRGFIDSRGGTLQARPRSPPRLCLCVTVRACRAWRTALLSCSALQTRQRSEHAPCTGAYAVQRMCLTDRTLNTGVTMLPRSRIPSSGKALRSAVDCQVGLRAAVPRSCVTNAILKAC